jgi:hypothetical protein
MTPDRRIYVVPSCIDCIKHDGILNDGHRGCTDYPGMEDNISCMYFVRKASKPKKNMDR